MDYQGILHTRLEAPPYYNQCSDCHSPGPTWCSVNFHVFLCTRCATLHKQYLNKPPTVSQIKSINLDRWTPQEIDIFCSPDPLLDSHIHLFCNNNNVYDLQNLILNKYNQLSTIDTRPRLDGRRKATNYELSQFGNQIRLIQNISHNQFYSIDLIVEALLLSNNNIEETMSLLNKYIKSKDSNTSQPPQLPKRPNSQIKPAVFDGTNIISNQYTNNSLNSNHSAPRPAVFDGTVDFTQQQQYPMPPPYTSNIPQQQTNSYSQQQNSPYPPYYTMANYPQ
ncbi:hypothetical protein MOUN0_D04940 [Monosporozyma unispora]|nr:hypothetical protein C6P44_002494 [Kazachstania unispora]